MEAEASERDLRDTLSRLGDLTPPDELEAASELESTIIRPGMFASNALFWWAPAIRANGAVRWPYGAAETAPVDDRDVAAVAARTLYQEGHAGGDYATAFMEGPAPSS